MSRLALRQGIDMDGDEEVGLVLVGDLCPSVEFHEGIGLTGIDDLHVRAVLLYHLPECEGIPQGQVLLLDLAITNGTRVTTTMTGIYHAREVILPSHDTNRPKQSYTYYYIP